MFNQQKLIGYHAGKTLLHALSGASKLIFFILVSVAAMMSYDTRFLLLVALASLMLFRVSEIRLKDISFVLAFAGTFCSAEYSHGLSLCTTVWGGNLRSQEFALDRLGSLIISRFRSSFIS